MKALFLSILLLLTKQLLFAQEITLTDIWLSNRYSSAYVEAFASMNDGEHFTRIEHIGEHDALVKYSFKTGKAVETLLDAGALKLKGFEDYSFSDNEEYVILKNNVTPIYRHSSTSNVYVYNLKSKKLVSISNGGQIGLPSFNADNSKIAYTKKNNLYYTDLITEREVQITFDGKQNEIINGAPDWVYEEEFSFDKGYAWSPKGNYLVYYKFNETNVPQYSLEHYNGTNYPSLYTFKYPKAGEENSQVSLHMYEIASKKEAPINLNVPYEYIPRIKFTPHDHQLSVQTLNRHQNELNFILVDLMTNQAKTLFTEKSNTYIDITDNLTFLTNRDEFIFTSESSGYHHIYLYNYKGEQLRALTSGNYDIDQMLGVDELNNKVYFTSAEVSPLERHLYAVPLKGSGKIQITQEAGTHEISFSKGFKYYIDSYSNANTPPQTNLYQIGTKVKRTLETNSNLLKELQSLTLSPKEFFSFTTDQGHTLNAYMIKPTNFKEGIKYPVVMHVYGGPGSQTVTNSWEGKNHLWEQYLAQKGYLVVSVDNRGTGFRGSEFKKCTYKELGKIETEDQIAAAKYLGKLPYIDANRIGIWGWSYGGYMSALCITKGAEVFKMAMAVAPVSNWKFYDSIYTERYMQSPSENPGYDSNSPIEHAHKLKAPFLLVHGTGDDNVHVQNSIELVNAFIDNDKHIDFQLYPGRNHGIYGGNTRFHLYTKLSNFILENL